MNYPIKVLERCIVLKQEEILKLESTIHFREKFVWNLFTEQLETKKSKIEHKELILKICNAKKSIKSCMDAIDILKSKG